MLTAVQEKDRALSKLFELLELHYAGKITSKELHTRISTEILTKYPWVMKQFETTRSVMRTAGDIPEEGWRFGQAC